MASSALPLKVGSTSSAATPSRLTNGTSSGPDRSANATPTKIANAGSAAKGVTNPADISSPHELTAYVEDLLEQLDAKFDDMSTQILDRMMAMSSRVDALEASIQDIINSDITPGGSIPPSPGPSGGLSMTPTPGVRRSGSGK
ncbi:hypothetical protein EWM64_g7087 [Hericium alpestre]|uniref:Heat shock factor-binding protein 1 n=1 Tax=Hericium alpestre TaxID=135208 RepID=A0A4Y9ZQR4_9AGAM|nr:hypothetical protein EWM64_g7087 [Hericium alpestre]